MEYQATLDSPLGKLGIVTTSEKLKGIHFLPETAPMIKPKTYVAKETVLQLQCYFADPFYAFHLPIEPSGTPFQETLWNSLLMIPVGKTYTYAEHATQLKSSPRAVGNACRANPIPIVIPCHRIVAKNGLGGYMGEIEGMKCDHKKWLIEHEASTADAKSKANHAPQKINEPKLLFV